MNVEHRSVKVAASSPYEGVIEMRVVTYNGQPDAFGSIWRPGCLSAGLDKRLPVICWSHDVEKPIGRGTSWRDTADGPLLTARLDNHPDVPLARQAIAQLASGTLTDVSLGFSGAVREAPSQLEELMYPDAREAIVSAFCHEVSIVFSGAVAGAEVLSLRSHPNTTAPSNGGRDLALAVLEGRMTPEEWRRSRAREAELDRRVDNLAAAGRADARLAEAERAADEALRALARWRW